MKISSWSKKEIGRFLSLPGADLELIRFLHFLIILAFLILSLLSIRVFGQSQSALIYFLTALVFFLLLWSLARKGEKFYIFAFLVSANLFVVITAFVLHSFMIIGGNSSQDFSLLFLGCLLGILHDSMITTENQIVNAVNYTVMQVLSIIKIATTEESKDRCDIFLWLTYSAFSLFRIFLKNFSRREKREEMNFLKSLVKERDYFRNFVFSKCGHPVFFLERAVSKPNNSIFLNVIQQNEEAVKSFRVANAEELRKTFSKINTYCKKLSSKGDPSGGSDYKEKIGSLYEEALEWTDCKDGKNRESGIVLDGDVEDQDSFKSFIIALLPGIEVGTLFVSLIDISDRIDLKRMRALDQYKDRMIETVSHDLRTPLKNITNVFKLLLNAANNTNANGGSYDRESYRMLLLGSESCDLMMNFLQSILDLEQIKEGKIKLKLSEFNLRQLVKEVINVIKYEAKEKGVSLTYEIDQELPQEMYSDKIRLKQVLLNLLSNSLKFTQQGQVKVFVRRCRVNNSDCARFLVQDTGLGIPPDIIPKLFKPFSTFEGSEGQNSGGVGLGLMICQNIVSLLGPYNRLFCSSQINKGSKFSFILYNNKEGFESNKAIINSKSKETSGFRPFGANDTRSFSSFELEFFNDFSTTPRNPTNRRFDEVGHGNRQDFLLEYDRPVIKSVSSEFSEGDLEEFGGLKNNIVESVLMMKNFGSHRPSNTITIPQGGEFTSSPNEPILNKSSMRMSISTEWNFLELNRTKKPTYLSRGKSNSIQYSSKREEDSLLGVDEYLQTPLSSVKRLSLNTALRRVDRKVKILIVDDNIFTHSVMEGQFKCCKFEFPFQILHAYNGSQALGMLAEEFSSPEEAKSYRIVNNDSEEESSPDIPKGLNNRRASVFKRVSIIVFTDINMPVMNGFALMEKIKLAHLENTFPFIPVVCISSDNVVNDGDLKFDEVLSVPVEIGALKKSVERWLT